MVEPRFPYATVNYFRYHGFEKTLAYVMRNTPGLSRDEADWFINQVTRSPTFINTYEPRKENMKWLP